MDNIKLLIKENIYTYYFRVLLTQEFIYPRYPITSDAYKKYILKKHN